MSAGQKRYNWSSKKSHHFKLQKKLMSELTINYKKIFFNKKIMKFLDKKKYIIAVIFTIIFTIIEELSSYFIRIDKENAMKLVEDNLLISIIVIIFYNFIILYMLSLYMKSIEKINLFAKIIFALFNFLFYSILINFLFYYLTN
jgi:hypothetical protein